MEAIKSSITSRDRGLLLRATLYYLRLIYRYIRRERDSGDDARGNQLRRRGIAIGKCSCPATSLF